MNRTDPPRRPSAAIHVPYDPEAELDRSGWLWIERPDGAGRWHPVLSFSEPDAFDPEPLIRFGDRLQAELAAPYRGRPYLPMLSPRFVPGMDDGAMVAVWLPGSEAVVETWPRDDSAMPFALASIFAAGSPAVRAVVAERLRQIAQEGFDEAHDDKHLNGELAGAASAYAMAASVSLFSGGERRLDDPPPFFRFGKEFWKPSEPRRDLVKAAALCLAEIDRIDRAAARGRAEGGSP